MDLKEIRKIVEVMNEHGLTHFDLSMDDFHLKLKKGQDLDSLRELMSIMPSAGVAAATAAPAVVPSSDPPETPGPVGEAITSPMVGTFYRKPSPDAANFVEVGDPISEGQTLCIIEAMKVMNEIKAERSGTITAVLAEDGEPVQFGDELFRIK